MHRPGSSREFRVVAACSMLWVALLVGCSGPGAPFDPPGTQDCDDPHENRDPGDGKCKCGPVENGLVCPPGSECQPQSVNHFTCLSTLCNLVTCEHGMSCDPTTGACQCGGVLCAASQRCEQSVCTPPLCDGVTCAFGLTCDPSDGACKCEGVACTDSQVCAEGKCVAADRCQPAFGVDCGITGTCSRGTCACSDQAACDPGRRCASGTCIPDLCYGVNCAAGTRCNAMDGVCHCVGADTTRSPTGPVCLAGEVCLADGSCYSAESCKDVDCGAGAVCDLSDFEVLGAVCRCGGLGQAYPRCATNQACDFTSGSPRCLGDGPSCNVSNCDASVPGSSCDPEDGSCRCGGIGGAGCSAGNACVPAAGVSRCAPRCDPLGTTCSGCYWNALLKLAVCLDPGTAAEGAPCAELNDCAPGRACLPGSQGNRCVTLCPLDRMGACPDGEFCVALDTTAGSNLGQCFQP